MGRILWCKIRADKEHTGVIWSIIDISERKLAEETIKNLAFYDTLTGLTNRRLLEDRLSLMISNKKRTNDHGTVLFLDLDNFKILNDNFGHQAGDNFLIEVASRLLFCVRETDTVARLGGDEFVVVIDGLAPTKNVAESEILTFAQKILQKLSDPYEITLSDDTTSTPPVRHLSTASIGVSLFDRGDDSTHAVLHRADQAMYLVKKSDKNDIEIL